MATQYRAKSSNYWDAAQTGALSQWVHIDAGNIGRTTVTPSTLAPSVTSKAIKPILLQNVVVNTTGATSPIVVSDSAVGVIAVLKPSISEKDYHYNIPIKGNLVIDNPGGADLTVVYIRD